MSAFLFERGDQHWHYQIYSLQNSRKCCSLIYMMIGES